MPLTVHFTETFQGETVQLRFGEAETMAISDLRTDPCIGLARSIALPIGPNPILLSASLWPRGRAVSVAIDPGTLEFLRVRLNEARLQLTLFRKDDRAAKPRDFA